MRKLARVVEIEEIKAIENADKICAYRVEGWWVVDTINKYKMGDVAIYFEIDSFIPTDLAPFLTKNDNPRIFNGVKGERLKTIKLRGQISQGLLLGIDILTGKISSIPYELGLDVSELLNIQKYENTIPAQLSGEAKGLFPSFIFKTDEERIQNFSKELKYIKENNLSFEVTEKLDGSSMTVYLNQGIFGVCSRNLDLKETENNSFWKMARELDLETRLIKYNSNIAIQGELIGPGIQGNKYCLKKQEFRIFNIFDIDNQCNFSPLVRKVICLYLGLDEMNCVPILAEKIVFPPLFEIDNILNYAEGKSQLKSNIEREGLVFKCNETPEIHFKSISNKFLLKEFIEVKD